MTGGIVQGHVKVGRNYGKNKEMFALLKISCFLSKYIRFLDDFDVTLGDSMPR